VASLVPRTGISANLRLSFRNKPRLGSVCIVYMDVDRFRSGFSGALPAVRRMDWRVNSGLSGLLGVLLFATGCSRSPEAIPASPPAAAQAVVEALADHRPQVLWDALPSGYQADIQDLITSFCTHMDADIYDRAFGILAKAVRVMKEKEEFVFNSPIALSVPMLESSMGSQWNETVGLLNTIAKSDLSTLDSLSRMDPGDFLASTGHQVMDRVETLRKRSQRSPKPNRWEQMSQAFEDTRIDFLVTSDTHGSLRFGSRTNDAVREVELTQVEGRWVPSGLAATWRQKVEEARSNIARLSGPEFEKARPMLVTVLSSLEGAMDSLLQAESQQEFDNTLRSLAAVGGMLQAMRNQP